jgi:hypothetical protein
MKCWLLDYTGASEIVVDIKRAMPNAVSYLTSLKEHFSRGANVKV